MRSSSTGANFPARIGLVSSARPARPTDAHRCSALPADRRRSIGLAPYDPRSIQLAPNGPSPGKADYLPPTRIGRRPLARLAASSGLRRLLPQLPRLASASGLLRLLSPSGFTGRPPLSLRLAVSSPAEPLMHSLLPPNLASPAEPSMSIPFPPAFASSGITQFKQLPACAVFCHSWCVQRSLSGLRPRFHPLSGLTVTRRLSPADLPVLLAGDQRPARTERLPHQPSGN